MLRFLKLMLPALLVVFAYSACEKEYSEENGLLPGSAQAGTQSGTAVFALVGAPGSCATPLVSGSYTVGTALDASNTVILTVDVTSPGTYVISTGTSNGITFSGSGDFTVTGTQVLVLTGSGTPNTAGINAFSPGTAGCTFTITSTSVVIPPTAEGTLDCTMAIVSGTYTQGVALDNTNTIAIPVIVSNAGTYNITTAAVNGATFTGSGTLNLGPQVILLTGSGTPAAAGNFGYPVSLGTSNCSVQVTFN